MTGRLIGICRAREKMAPLELLETAEVSLAAGIAGDVRGTKPGRQVTVLFREGWEDACRDARAPELTWLTRRANLYVEGLERPRETGVELAIGEMVLRVVEETRPCALMEAALPGLRAAMRPDWRGGVCCDVVRGGVIRLGDAVGVKQPRS
jgi:MOSC domain-containing protein YiiM